jgi:hypothetical protein
MNFMQKNYSGNQLSLGNAFKFTPNKSNMSRMNSYNSFSNYSNYSSAASSTCDYDHDNSFNYDSEDADANLLVGQAHQYCEATRGGKKKQFNTTEER